jgi:hypothetical protein
MLMDYDVMLIDIYVLTDSIDEFPLSVQDTWQIEDADRINGTPWTPDWVMEWIVWFEYFIYEYVTYDRVYYDVVYVSLNFFRWWMQDDDFLLIWLT